jgi:hypothetical protein
MPGSQGLRQVNANPSLKFAWTRFPFNEKGLLLEKSIRECIIDLRIKPENSYHCQTTVLIVSP